MDYDPDKHWRKSIRKDGFDYTSGGGYFVTICTSDKRHLFGSVQNGMMQLNGFGKIVVESWEWLSGQYDYVRLDEWCVMPNHFHGIIVMMDDGKHTGKPLGGLIGAFKTVSTKKINMIRGTPGAMVWQRNYYERIIRDDEWERIVSYIKANPSEWHTDRENPEARYQPPEKPWQV